MARDKKGKDKPKAEPCPKCGSTEGWSGPHYQKAVEGVIISRAHPSKLRRTKATVGEHLAWSCKVCGFSRTEKTKDA